MDLYNVQTKARESIDDPAKLQEALAAGTHSFKKGSKVGAFAPDGSFGYLPAENIGAAMRDGFRPATKSQVAIQEYLKENDDVSGTAKVFLGQLADEALLGLPELILDKTQDPLEVAKREALKKEHSLANTLGGITGFAGSMFYGGPLWKGAAKAGAASGKLVENLAAKIVTKSSGEVSKREAMSIARGLAPKLLGKGTEFATEGALLSAPQAITEAALGDPEAAGETLLAGIGLGVMFGGAGPLAKEMMKASRKAAQNVTRALPQNAPEVARKIAKVFTGVNEDDVLYYVKNRDRVNKALLADDIKLKIDEDVARVAEQLNAQKQRIQEINDELADIRRITKYEARAKQAPEALERELPEALANEQRVLSSLSEQAEDALARGRSYRRDDLLRLVDKIGKSKPKNMVSDVEIDAVETLYKYRNRIAAFPEELSGNDVRAIMRGLRKDIARLDDAAFDRASGEWNPDKVKILTDLSETISDTLKRENKEYAEYMKRMAPLTKSVNTLARYFGKPERVASTLRNIWKPENKYKLKALKEYDALAGTNFVGALDEFRAAKDLLEKAKGAKDIAELVAPEKLKELVEAQAALAKAQETFNAVKRLSPSRTQSVIRGQSFKRPSIEDQKALKALSDLTGFDYMEEIKARNVYDAFFTDSTNGSRKTLLGALLGSAVDPTGVIGAAAGATAGASADNYGGQLLKKFIDWNPDKTGILFAERSMKHTAEKLDRIPGLLKNLAERANKIPPSIASIEAARRLNRRDIEPKHMSENERVEWLRDLDKKLARYSAMPQAFVEDLSGLSGFIGDSAPNINAAFNKKAFKALEYLNKNVPRSNAPLNPFAPKIEYVPSDTEIKAFMDKAAVVQDPFVVLDELEAGTLNRNHMDALINVYPGIHSMIQRKVQDQMMEGVEPVDYASRVKLSLLLRAPMDVSMTQESIDYYQQTFALASQAESQEADNVNVDLAGANYTEGQNLMMG